MGKVAELFVYDQFNRVPVDQVEAGDICALTGIDQASIGETVCDAKDPKPLPTIQVRQPLLLFVAVVGAVLGVWAVA